MHDLNDPVVEELVRARVQLLFDQPFLGQLATRLNLVDASSWCSTAATDGRNLYYNREFIKSLTKPELMFLVGHEIYHICFDHLGRRNGRDPKIWNYAIDYIVNYGLVRMECGEMPECGLYDPRYTDDMSSEEVYELLKQNSVTVEMPMFDEHLDAEGDDSDDDDDGAGGSDGSDDGDEDEDDGNGKPKKPGGTMQVTVMGKNGKPKLSKEELEKLRQETRARIIQAAQSCQDASQVPGSIRRMIQELTQPKLDWRALLDAHIRSSVRDDYTFQKLSRRSWSVGAFLPGMSYRDTVEVAIAVDTSGSISDQMLRDFLSEVKGIMETFGEFKIYLWHFDTEVHNPVVFTAENIDDIYTYEIKGRGGTLFEANWTYMKDEGLEPPRLCVFTDGYPGASWGDPDYVDTLFIIHGSTEIEAPFGITCYYEDHKLKKAA